ncbi:hypothetical protein CDL12_05734 [Handroanthus impetiginosus]|uniref:Uncharacterized protein n=1 Tax=Handroanthus impetiginosus TaxID=429701 RepID=A0A2G9HVS0_9LAMI|nr:hypothetical protein CDL12_05734 [Handroanthus impetiginosus]
MITANNIKATPLQTNNFKEFMKFVKECSQTANQSLASTLMSTLTNTKFDRSRTMHEHVLEMTNLVPKLKTLGMAIDWIFLV